jgi:DICT domain-containing protein/predicted DNA-binding transcriptional regulator AlpA
LSEFTMGEVVERTGIAEGTLRMWERRHGFPNPVRLISGHRRYSERDVEAVRLVVAERAAGVTLPVAIERATRPVEDSPSLYAWLRRSHPELDSRVLSRPAMLALSNAIEDESLARAERPLLFASFQRERAYRHQQARWQELSRGAEFACVFADFERSRHPRGGPREIKIDNASPLVREWAVVCDAPGYGVCLAGWERPAGGYRSAANSSFESVWTVEPQIVRGAASVCAAMAAGRSGALEPRVQERLDAPATQLTRHQLTLAAAIANRAFSYLPELGAIGA